MHIFISLTQMTPPGYSPYATAWHVIEEPIPSRINLDNQLQTVLVIELLHLESLHYLILFPPQSQ